MTEAFCILLEVSGWLIVAVVLIGIAYELVKEVEK